METPPGTTAAIFDQLQQKFGAEAVVFQPAVDRIPTVWVGRDKLLPVMRYLKGEIERPYRMLYDLTGIDERVRAHREAAADRAGLRKPVRLGAGRSPFDDDADDLRDDIAGALAKVYEHRAALKRELTV